MYELVQQVVVRDSSDQQSLEAAVTPRLMDRERRECEWSPGAKISGWKLRPGQDCLASAEATKKELLLEKLLEASDLF